MKKIVARLSMLCVVLAAGAAAFFLFFGSDGGSAEPSELVGSWHGSRGAELILHEDGSLTAVNVPTDFSEHDEPIKPFTGKGTWNLDKKPKLGDQEISLSLGEVFGSKIGIQVTIMGKGARGGLSFRVSVDSSRGFTFGRPSPA
ncbi:hypothetical protein ACPCTO_16350 [Streptomyces olivoreticuli]